MVSAKGSPGVTTAALALGRGTAAPVPPVVMIELDPSGGDLAGRLGEGSGRGLTTLASTHGGEADIDEHLHELDDSARVLLGPSSPSAASASVKVMCSRPEVLSGLDAVVVDAGRWSPHEPHADRVGLCEQVWVVGTRDLESLSHVRHVVPALRAYCESVGLALVGSGGYDNTEIEKALGVPVAAEIPFDEAGAAAVTRPLSPRTRRLPLLRWGRKCALAMASGVGA